ncbi:MAG TPA: PCP reductase family protein [Nitrospiraceae bacterium]|nr:PCP reductase family protein [Nitrospiraceae bacterium]
MHTEGIEEHIDATGIERWFVRSKCCGCGFRVGIDLPADRAIAFVDRFMWTDDARHRLDRMPPYLAPLVKEEVECYAKARNHRVVTYELIARAQQGEAVAWDPEAERRLSNVPTPVRAMARVELERTAMERGLLRVTVDLMEEVKARYFGLSNVRRGT